MTPITSPLLEQPSTFYDCYPVLKVDSAYRWGRAYFRGSPFMDFLIDQWYAVRSGCDLPQIVRSRCMVRNINQKYLKLPHQP